MNFKKLLSELKRRNVFKVAGVYAVAGWVLIQIAATTFPFFGIPAWGVRFVVGLVLLGFPIAIILAWAFELTPEGMKRTEEVPAEESVTKKTGRKLNIVLGILLALAVGIIFYQDLYNPSAASTKVSESGKSFVKGTAVSQKSIAVLPFANDSGDSSQRYFSDGLSENLIIALSQYAGLKVIGRESSFQFRGKNLDSRSIGKKLGVAHLLEGSVSREGKEVRIRAELVNTIDGSTLWSDFYDRPYKNLFALQDNITQTVAQALKAKLLQNKTNAAMIQSNRPQNGNLKAYNAFLKGNFYFNRFTENDFRKAIKYYRQAIKLDTTYIAAYAALSYVWSRLGAGYLSGSAKIQAYDRAQKSIRTALRLDPDSWAVHWANSSLLNYELKWFKAKTEVHKALEFAPNNAQVLFTEAENSASLGMLKLAVQTMQHALQIDPLNATEYYTLSYYLSGLNQPEKAEHALHQAIALQPTASAFHTKLVQVLIQQGITDSLLYEANHESDPGWSLIAHTWSYFALGQHSRADSVLHLIIRGYSGVAAYQIAETYALRKQPDQAFSWLNRALKQYDPGIGELLYDPVMLQYKGDPRFTAFCRKVRLPVPGNTQTNTTSFIKDSKP